MKQEEFEVLFDEWNQALQTGDPAKVAAFYTSDGLLLPTMSSKLRHNNEEIKDYFEQFLKSGPVGTLVESNIRSFGEVSINSGLYSFSFKDGSNKLFRYTFVYRWNGKRWMIADHHSSRIPEE